MTAFRNAVAPDVAADYRACGWWGDVTLLDHVRRHARERPDDAAIIADAGTLSWAAYERAATRVAAALVDVSIPEGARVAVILPDSGTVHAVFLGAELAGVTVVGIGALGRRPRSPPPPRADPRLRARQSRTSPRPARPHHCSRIGCRKAARRSAMSSFRASRSTPTGRSRWMARRPRRTVPAEALEARRIGPDDLFLVNSTSGTTGLPKCVMHTQNRWLTSTDKRCGADTSTPTTSCSARCRRPLASACGPRTSHRRCSACRSSSPNSSMPIAASPSSKPTG